MCCRLQIAGVKYGYICCFVVVLDTLRALSWAFLSCPSNAENENRSRAE
jgi:hypothetical protein